MDQDLSSLGCDVKNVWINKDTWGTASNLTFDNECVTCQKVYHVHSTKKIDNF